MAINILKDGGFLTLDEDHFLHLTNAGREVAERILRNSGVSEDTIEAFRLYDRQAFNSDRRYRERVQVLFPLPLRRSVIF